MDIDVGFWLTWALLVALVIWGADRLWALHRRNRVLKETVELSNSLLPVFFVVLVIRSFLFEPFTIPSGSMLPTLQVNDFILVNKFSYGLRLPITNTLVVPLGEPKRGDVMVFRYPVEPNQNFIKRVLGVPGDVITQRNDRLYVNGELIPREDLVAFRTSRRLESYHVETLDGTRHLIRQARERLFDQWLSNSQDQEWVVGEGEYFMVGDNRNDSKDSRSWGMVPEDHIVGKAVTIWMHWQPIFSWPSFSRNGAIDKQDYIDELLEKRGQIAPGDI